MLGNEDKKKMLDLVIDAILIKNPITEQELLQATGLSGIIVKEWLEIIETIQDLPKILIEHDRRGVVVNMDGGIPSDRHVINAVAFFGDETVSDLCEDDISVVGVD